MKKLLALLLCLAVLAALAGCATKNDPESLALSFMEHYYGADYDEMVKTIYPDLVDDEFEETFTQIMASMKDSDFIVKDFTVGEKELRSDEARAAYEQDLNEEYGLSIELDELYYITVEYSFSGTVDGTSYETDASAIVAVAKIGGKWYVVNGDESKHYGYDTAENAALTFYEAYFAMDYETMSTTFYPDVDNDETREGFEYVLELMTQDEFTCSNFSVTSTEKRSDEECAEWEQKMKDEYGSEVVISELYYVEVSYDFVGTVDGEDYDETESALLPVAQIGSLWYVLDGVVSTEAA